MQTHRTARREDSGTLAEQVYDEALRRSADALAEFVADPTPDTRASFWHQVSNLRTANAVLSGRTPEPDDDSFRGVFPGAEEVV
jgi:hypothetical protein